MAVDTHKEVVAVAEGNRYWASSYYTAFDESMDCYIVAALMVYTLPQSAEASFVVDLPRMKE